MVVFQILLALQQAMAAQGTSVESSSDQQFQQLAERYVNEFPALSPVSATVLGDHRFDAGLDEVSDAARSRSRAFCRGYLEQLGKIDAVELTSANQIDHAMLEHHLRAQLWRLDQLQEWAWNPLVYTELAGGALYGLMARDFAPLEDRLARVADRLEQFPRLFRQIRATLDPARVPKIHAETAVKQNPGLRSILDVMVEPQLGELPDGQRQRLAQAIAAARTEVQQHQKWLESQLLPNALGDFRLGTRLYDEKLAFTLQTPLTRPQVRQQAKSELHRVRAQMYAIAKKVYKQTYPHTQFPTDPSPEYQQAIIRSCLELAYRETPSADEIVETAERGLDLATALVREKDLVTVPDDPIEIIVMPEFQRGVALAYCDSPGPLDVGQKTFYAVAPPPKSWDAEQVRSLLREYNTRSVYELTIHEAMPGHFLQLAHSNRYPGKLRAVLSSGVFIEGWAVYAEQMMAEQGFLDGDPLMHVIALKWYLRGIANAILDQAIHTEGMTRDEAMRLMMEDTFQEEREAAAKWIRAQLTSAQLSTYFVGYLQHRDLRREAEKVWGDDFHLKTYHDRVISFGSPPVQFVRALLFDREVPR